MAHLEFHHNHYRLVIKHDDRKRRIPLGTDNWYWAVARAHHLHNVTLDGGSIAEVFFQILAILESQVSPITVENYRQAWQKFSDRFDRIDISEITPRLLAVWKKELSEAYSVSTVSIFLRSVRSVFSVLKRMEIVKTNPFEQLKKFVPKATQRSEYLEPRDCNRLIEAASSDPLAQNYIMLLLATGIRRGELYNFKWSHIDEKRSRIELVGKTGTRYFPLWIHVKVILDVIRKIQPEDTEYVFTTKDFDRPFEASYIGRMVSKYARLAKFKNVSTHTLRHTFGTNMVPKVGIRAVQKLMGHSRIETTCRYENASVLDIPETKFF